MATTFETHFIICFPSLDLIQLYSKSYLQLSCHTVVINLYSIYLNGRGK